MSAPKFNHKKTMDNIEIITRFEFHHEGATVRIKKHGAGFLILAHYAKPFPFRLHYTEDGENVSLLDSAGNRAVLDEVINRLTAPQKEAA